MKIEWSPTARASAHRYLANQDGMRAIGVAVADLASNPYPRMRFTEVTITGCVSVLTGWYTSSTAT